MKHLKPRKDTGPEFLFSTWPPIEWGKCPIVLVEPSGADDTARMQAAVNRLVAVGGGIIRLTVGDYQTSDTVYVRPENLFLERPK